MLNENELEWLDNNDISDEPMEWNEGGTTTHLRRCRRLNSFDSVSFFPMRIRRNLDVYMVAGC